MALELTGAAFRDGTAIPDQYTADGRNISPPLKWRDQPAGTRLALICEDPDAPAVRLPTGWRLTCRPSPGSYRRGFPQKQPCLTAWQGASDFGQTGYGGPKPPPGKPHHYVFKLYWLDRPLDVRPGATKAQVLAAMKGHVLGEAQLQGTYGAVRESPVRPRFPVEEGGIDPQTQVRPIPALLAEGGPQDRQASQPGRLRRPRRGGTA